MLVQNINDIYTNRKNSNNFGIAFGLIRSWILLKLEQQPKRCKFHWKNVKNTEKKLCLTLPLYLMYTYIHICIYGVYLRIRKERANGTEGIPENSHQQFSVSL